MTHDPRKLHDLLEDVLPPHETTRCGPDRAALLRMVRAERTRRRDHRTLGAAGLGAVIVLLMSFAQGWLSPSESKPEAHSQTSADADAAVQTSTHAHANAPSADSVAPPPPSSSASPLVIQQVNDEQLLALLQDTPAALMVWPNGRRTLLVVGQ